MLGEQGKLFVEAAESIREASVSYDSAIDAVKQELSEAKAEISALKEQVSHLVGLLKDNNVATTKLMKRVWSSIMCFHSVTRFQLTCRSVQTAD